MTTATINTISSALNEYLAVERRARAELLGELYQALEKADEEYLDFMDVMDTEEIRLAYEATAMLRSFINLRNHGYPVSEMKKQEFLEDLRALTNDAYVEIAN